MKMEYKTRQELNELSLKAFGVSSRWKKIMDRGLQQTYERDREVVLAMQNGKLEKKVFTDQKVVIHRLSAEEVKNYMVQIIETKNALQKVKEQAAKDKEDGSNIDVGAVISGEGIPEGTTVTDVSGT